MTPSRILAIWIKRAHRGPMDSVQEATLHEGRGLGGSADQGGRRQITIISRDRWDRVDEDLGVAVNPAARRANVLVTGLDLVDSRGKKLELGSCEVLIHGETTACERMDDEYPGLGDALADGWGGGVYGEIVTGGSIRVGDRAVWGREPPAT